MVGRTATITQADDLRFEIISEIGCLCCLIDGWPCVPCQVDHLLNGYRHQDEHRHTIGICPWHHQGHPIPPHCCGSVREATTHHGPSRRHNSKAFRDRYGGDGELLELQDSMIEQVQAARDCGVFLTPGQLTRMVLTLRSRIGLAAAV